MKTRSWKSAARGACLLIVVAFAGHLAAAVGARGARAAGGTKPCARETVVRGRGLVTFGGYELNVTFTTEGRLLCFDITDAPSA